MSAKKLITYGAIAVGIYFAYTMLFADDGTSTTTN